jgi:hypothetical protein
MAATIALASRTDIDPDQLLMPAGALAVGAATKLLKLCAFFALEPGKFSYIFVARHVRGPQRA